MAKIIEPIVNNIIHKMPDKTIKSKWWENQIGKIGKYSSPESRLILGASALASQPFFDLYNKDVDEDTRKVSCARTIAKTIAGTFTGYFIRKWCIKSIDALARTPKELEEMAKASKKITKWSTALIPTKVKENGEIKNLTPEQFENAVKLVKKHKNALGTCLALLVMIVTNFALDVPLTKFLTNMFNKMLQKTDKQNNTKKGGLS